MKSSDSERQSPFRPFQREVSKVQHIKVKNLFVVGPSPAFPKRLDEDNAKAMRIFTAQRAYFIHKCFNDFRDKANARVEQRRVGQEVKKISLNEQH